MRAKNVYGLKYLMSALKCRELLLYLSESRRAVAYSLQSWEAKLPYIPNSTVGREQRESMKTK